MLARYLWCLRRGQWRFIVMNEGWISIHRQIEDWKWYFSEPFTKTQAWIDMLLLANHTPGFFSIRGQTISVERGQIGWSEESLAKRWRWSRGKVRRFLKTLENEHQIVQQKSTVLGVITILNYDKFQQRTQNGTTDSTTERQQTVQQTDTNNNDNNKNNENNISSKEESSHVVSPVEKKSYGNEDVNKMLDALRKIVECDDFRESQKQQRVWASNLVRLKEKIGLEEFKHRLSTVLSDDFKRRNAASLQYLYREIKSFIS